MNAPYTYTQAQKLVEDYQHLIGTSLDGSSTIIESLSITPFDEASKQRFFLYYLIMDNGGQEAILKEYKGFLFDIIIMARDINGELIKEELGTWVNKNAVLQDFPLHTTQQANINKAFI